MGIYVVVVDMTGWAGGPGTCTLIFNGKGEAPEVSNNLSAQNAADQARAFFGDMGGIPKTGIVGTVRTPVIARNPISGLAIQEHSVVTTPLVFGGLGDQLPAASSLVVGWRTALPTRQGRGRTFIPPSTEAANDTDGTPTAAALSTVNTAATNLINAGVTSTLAQLVVWSRPAPLATPPRSGVARPVLTHRVRDTWGSLRSRRD